MNKKQSEEMTSDVLIADALLRVKTLENILVSKGIFTREEFQEELKTVTRLIAKSILQKSQISGDLDKLVDDLSENISDKTPQN